MKQVDALEVKIMPPVAAVGYVAKALGPALREEFTRGVPYLDGLDLRPNYGERVGRGYAIVGFNPSDMMDMRRVEPAPFVEAISRKLRDAARQLGAELLRHMRGEGSERTYEQALQEASGGEPAIAVSGVGVAKLGDALLHIGELPHISGDDGRWAHHAADRDQILVVVRFFAKVAPRGAP